ncbi:MAG: cellulase family glycosylhydrolase [Edaphobacter sp.]
MQRRSFIKGASALGSALTLSQAAHAASIVTADPVAPNATGETNTKQWRGFNLQWEQKPTDPADKPAYQEADFKNMSDWGFTFARLPVSYWVWGSPKDWTVINLEPVKQIDRAISLGRAHNIHINFCFYRIPGYCISRRELEPADLFTGRAADRARALDAAVYHWRFFARRYKGISNHDLSFDLFNEPPRQTSYEGAFQERYVEIVRALTLAIWSEDPNRMIFVDGVNAANDPVEEVADLHPVQATHCYQPLAVTHFMASWVRKDHYETFKTPTWPLTDDSGQVWDRAKLKQQYLDKYKPLTDRGALVHVSEFGCYNKTAHDVALAWMGDCLSLWHEAGWGWAVWNLRGDFGVMDSGRADVAYEDFQGHKLDRKMLELLRQAQG